MLTNKTYPGKFRRALAKSLESRGVEIVYNDFIDDVPADGVVGVTTRNGKKLDADVVVSNKTSKYSFELIIIINALL
jgi:phytoene dehydrogenase-like protein